MLRYNESWFVMHKSLTTQVLSSTTSTHDSSYNILENYM